MCTFGTVWDHMKLPTTDVLKGARVSAKLSSCRWTGQGEHLLLLVLSIPGKF